MGHHLGHQGIDEPILMAQIVDHRPPFNGDQKPGLAIVANRMRSLYYISLHSNSTPPPLQLLCSRINLGPTWPKQITTEPIEGVGSVGKCWYSSPDSHSLLQGLFWPIQMKVHCSGMNLPYLSCRECNCWLQYNSTWGVGGYCPLNRLTYCHPNVGDIKHDW